MSNAGPEDGKQRCGKAALVFCLLAAGVLGFTSCRRPAATTAKVPVTLASPSDEALDSAREALAKQNDLASCRAAVQQLNVHLGRHPEQKQQLDDKEKEQLARDLGLDKDEVAEVNSPTFTPLDVYHLDRCFLFRDVARSLDCDHLPAAERAAAAFAWVARQVRLDARDDALVPEQFVVRRGRGSSIERTLIFLALLDQMDVDGALVAFPPKNKGQEAQRWLAGALVGKDIYLFDSQLGLPLPGPDGGPATLAQVREQPELLRRLDAPGQPYDLTAAQVKGAEVFVGCPLSAVSARMKYLETELGTSNKVRLADNLAARVEKFRAAAGSSLPIRVWDLPGDPNAPPRILRLFLPPADGGVATPRRYLLGQLNGYAANGQQPVQMMHHAFFNLDLAPWQFLPVQIRGLEFNVELGARARALYMLRFSQFFTEPGHPRDLLLRGRLEEAVSSLMAQRDEIVHQEAQIRNAQNLEAGMAEWANQARQIQADFFRAKNRPAKDPAAADELKAAAERIELTWKAAQTPIALLLMKAWAEPMSAELNYQLALCKQEMAERLENGLKRPGANPARAEFDTAREAWKDASGWWQSFEQDYPTAPATPAARALHARACEKLGEVDRAIELLKNLSGPVTELEKIARLYRARQLGQKKR